MATSWTIRCRAPSGQSTISGVDPEQPVADFLQTLSTHTGIAYDKQQILAGFPPKPIQVADAKAPLRSLGLTQNDSITIRESATSVFTDGSASAPAAKPVPACPLMPPGAPASSAPPKPAAAAAAQQQPQQPARAQPASRPAPPPAATAAPALHAQPQQQQAPAPRSISDEDADLAAAIAASLADVAAPTQQAAQSSPPRRPLPARSSSPLRSHPIALTPSASAKGGAAPTSITLPDGSAVVRRIIDSDNSCLFNAVGYVMEHSRAKAKELRGVIAAVVAGDPVTYNEGFLGKDNDEYCRWIQLPDKWGGAIELSILASYYGREIAAYDIKTKRCDVYGQDAGYGERAMLIYDGLHYDAVAVAAFEGAPEDLDISVYSTASREAGDIGRGAEALVAAAHTARQFTDTANFTLRCGVCQLGLQGEKEAVEHAKGTGHTNFTEY